MRSVFKEVSQRERLQKLTIQLENANEKLKGLDKLKTEFISLASHQLRSPLTAIKGYASMLLEGSFKPLEVPEQKTAIERIFQSSMNLARVVEDLLDVSKIEQGGMKYEMSSIDIKKLAKDIADELKVTAKNKGLQLDFEEKDLGGYVVKADPVKIRQAILNLVDNSIKYTQSGFVKVVVTKPSVGKLRISIIDSGMGISEENMGKLFEKFSRGDGGKVNAGGSGLGLYLVKEIVEAHSGKVWAESQGVGKGSTFIVELPEVAEAEHSS
jgi:signal transduction histidine kinase